MSFWKKLFPKKKLQLDDISSARIFYYAQNGDVEAMKAILKDHRDLVFRKWHLGETALHIASAEGHTLIVEMLLRAGADVNAKDKNGLTPLINAAATGHGAVAKLLLAKKAEVNGKDSGGDTALRWATDKGHNDVAELLRSCGAHE